MDLQEPILSSLNRRQLLTRGARLGLGLPAVAWLAAACGSGGSPAASPTPLSGTALLDNYAGWLGQSEVKNFEKLFPGAHIKQVVDQSNGSAGHVQLLKNHPGAYDFTLGDEPFAEAALAAGLVETLDWSKIPNIKNVDAPFRNGFPHGIPTDYGKVGIGYRKDIVTEGITSWHDVWRLAPKYSGQIVFIDLDRDCIGSTLKYLGYSGNTTDPAQLAAAKNALIQIKPHLQAFKYVNVGDGLPKGTTAIAMDWDYDVALAQQTNPLVQWVLPDEGAVAYLEGWVAVKGTAHLDLVEAFMNFHLDPKSYADFVNTTGTAYVESAATPLITPAISKSPITLPDPTVLQRVEYERYLGAATALWAKTWDEIKSA